jgi:uncharacterized protein (DUF433 family)
MGETRIQSEPSIMMGKPVVAGTRITVELILEKTGGRADNRRNIGCARLTREGVLAALEFGQQFG